MRIIALVTARFLSCICGFLTLVAAGKLALGAYAVFNVLKEFPDASPSELGRIHGEFIGAPFFLTAVFAIAAVLLWRFSLRYRTTRRSNPEFQRTSTRAAE